MHILYYVYVHLCIDVYIHACMSMKDNSFNKFLLNSYCVPDTVKVLGKKSTKTDQVLKRDKQ